MKSILLLFLLGCLGSLTAQNDGQNLIKATVGNTFGSDGFRANTYEVAYQRHIGIGINVLVAYSKSNGGTSVNYFITDLAFDELKRLENEFEFSGVGKGFLGTFFSQSRFKVGVQKNVKMTEKIAFGLSIASVYSTTSETEFTNINYDNDGFLLVEDVDYLFASYSKVVAEIGLHLGTQLSSYTNAGLSVTYLSHYKFISPSLYVGVSF